MVPDQTLPEYVLGEAAEHGGRCALIDAASGEALTYAELVDKVGRAGHGLRAAGVRLGDVVALCSTNSIDFVVAWYAALTIGATVTTVSPHSKASEFTDHFLATDTRWVITTAHLFESVLRNAALSTAVAGTFVVDGDPAGATAFEQIIAAGKSCLPTGLASPSDTAFLPRSSGTSGLPKSVVLTHRNLVASLSQMRDAHGVTSSDTVLASLPLVHTFGLQVTLNLSLRAGACVVLMPRFEIEGFLDTIQRHHVTRAEIVPPIVQALANTDLLDDYDLSSLHVMTVGAAPMSSDLVTTCARRTGCHVKQVYGMTELAGSSHIAPDDGPDKPWSIGPTVQGVECRVIDPTTGAEVAAGQPGELLVRAPSVMRRYLNDEEATAAAIDADGWLHTGDVVTVDDEGWYEVVDRLKEMIKYKGFQVAPAELEQLLLSHPSVADAAVVGLPDDEAGEVPQAFVVRRTALTDDELMAWVAERVTPYKRIRRVEFVESIPKSPSGKILRRLLARPQQIPARELDGAVALVSGGGRGLGRFLAERLVDAGARVALIGRSEASLEDAAASIRARGGIVATAVADVTDIERTRAAVRGYRAARADRRARQQRRHQRPDGPALGDRSGGVVARRRDQLRRRLHAHQRRTSGDGFGRPRPRHQHHQSGCRPSLAARLLLRRCEGRGGEADRDARGGVETARCQRVQLRSGTVADRAERGRAGKHSRSRDSRRPGVRMDQGPSRSGPGRGP